MAEMRKSHDRTLFACLRKHSADINNPEPDQITYIATFLKSDEKHSSYHPDPSHDRKQNLGYTPSTSFYGGINSRSWQELVTHKDINTCSNMNHTYNICLSFHKNKTSDKTFMSWEHNLNSYTLPAKYGIFGNHNENTRIWHFDLICWKLLGTKQQTSIVTLMQLSRVVLWTKNATCIVQN